jgi:alkylation response protein AidB-like acyl-CoA dehydrogenase
MPVEPTDMYVSSFGGTIAGGSNEIMRNLLAERILHMPRS